MVRARWSVATRIETRRAVEWYAERGPHLAERFEAELHTALSAVLEAPRRWAIWRPPAYRRVILKNFPYSLIFRIVDDERVFLVALLHHSRDPDRRFSP